MDKTCVWIGYRLDFEIQSFEVMGLWASLIEAQDAFLTVKGWKKLNDRKWKLLTSIKCMSIYLEKVEVEEVFVETLNSVPEISISYSPRDRDLQEYAETSDLDNEWAKFKKTLQ